MTETTERHAALQAAMNEGYKRWDQEGVKSLEDFYKVLTAREHFAVTIGNFNYQVENGGFSQWDGNGYAKVGATALVGYVRQILALANATAQPGHAAAARVVADLLSGYESAASDARDAQQEADDNEEELDRDPLYEAIEDRKLDNSYYAVNDAFMDAAEAYLVATFK